MLLGAEKDWRAMRISLHCVFIKIKRKTEGKRYGLTERKSEGDTEMQMWLA